MNKITKSTIIGGLAEGIVFAIFNAGLDFYHGHEFSIWKYIFLALIFGISMGFVTRYNIKKKLEKDNKD